MDWKEIGKRAFNRYLSSFNKFEIHDDSQDLAGGVIESAMEDAGIKIEHCWYEDLPLEALMDVATGFIVAFKGIEKEVGYVPAEDFMGALRTWFSDCMLNANAYKKDPKLESLIDEFNKM